MQRLLSLYRESQELSKEHWHPVEGYGIILISEDRIELRPYRMDYIKELLMRNLFLNLFRSHHHANTGTYFRFYQATKRNR